jgi:hypothetical protein
MKYKYVILAGITTAFIVGGMTPSSTSQNQEFIIDTLPVTQPIVNDVKGKKALFIGDSHTAANYGWQYQLCKNTQMSFINTSVGGKQTYWMLQTAKTTITEYFDYCFIYGGANDMAGNRPPIRSVKNIQNIVNICNQNGVKAIVITGFDPLTCIDVKGRSQYAGYPKRYAIFQKMLSDSIQGATVVKTHCISQTDCGDFLCHMTANGHKKMALCIIDKLNLKTYENPTPTKKR